jgi:translation initiation factor 2 alpha subunit (eIF-2alpha)
MTTSTPDRQKGIEVLSEAIQAIEKTIKANEGLFAVQMPVSCLALSVSFDPEKKH